MRVFNSLGSDNSSISHRELKSVFVQFQNWQICLRSKKSKFEISVFRILCEVRVLFQKVVFYPCSSRVTEIQPHTRQTFVFWAVWNGTQNQRFSGISRKNGVNVWHLNELKTVSHKLSVLSRRVWGQEQKRIPLLSTSTFRTQTPFCIKLRVQQRFRSARKKFPCQVRRSDTGFAPLSMGKQTAFAARSNKPTLVFFWNVNFHNFGNSNFGIFLLWTGFSRKHHSMRIIISGTSTFEERWVQKTSFYANHHFSE